MKYLLDQHSIAPRELLREKRSDVCIVDEVLEEGAYFPDEMLILRRAVEIVSLAPKHLQVVKDIMSLHGFNTRLIRLYDGSGAGDVAMLAYALSERDDPTDIFSERDYTLVTQDKELIAIAGSYGITCVSTLPNSKAA